MISTIFIANLAEISLDLVHFMHKSDVAAEISEDHALCDRFIFSLSNNSILITPYLIDSEFFQDSLKIAKLKNIANLAPVKIGESLCAAILADKGLLSKIIAEVKANPAIKLISYAGTPDFFALVDHLKNLNLQFATPEIPSPHDRWTNSFFGSKAGFVQATAVLDSAFPPIPQSIISSSRDEIIGWAKLFLQKNNGVVLKTNHGLAGAGLKILESKNMVGDTQTYLKKLLQSEAYWQNGPIVVEQFIPPDMQVCGGAPNVELRVHNNKVRPLYVCSMRVTPDGVFQGVEFGQGAVPNKIQKTITTAGLIFGNDLLKHGYNGFFEIDFVAGLDGKIYPIESNLRRTGGTHAFELAQKLFGPGALENNYFVTNNRLIVSKNFKSYQNIKHTVQDLLFPMAETKKGLLLTIVSNLSRHRLGYMIAAPTKDEAYTIEARFLKRLT